MERELECPECGAPMVLRETKKYRYNDGTPRKFYGCCRFPACDGVHGAHQSGEPYGIPANKETKRARMKAHDSFDALWKHGDMTRKQAYMFLATEMGIAFDDCHIGRFDKDQCKQVVDICLAKQKEMME